MNLLALEIRFWETIYHLVYHEHFRLVHISENNKEVWLEDERRNEFQLIRLALRDLDWSNELRQDIMKAFYQGKKLKKQLSLRQTNVLNIVFSLYEPVDSYEEYVNEPIHFTSGGQQKQKTVLVPFDKMEEKMNILASQLNLSEPPRYLPIDYAANMDEMVPNLLYGIYQASQNRLEQERKLFLFGKPIFTYFFLIVNLIAFFIVEFYGSSTSTTTLVQFGAKFNPLILDGEWWRFITAMFLHIGIFHLLMNSLALYYLGTAVEQIYGSIRFFLIYMFAGLVGSIASFTFNEQVSAGASGAIFGCFGALLFFGVKHRRLFFRTIGMNVIFILAINLVFGFVIPMIDNGAHLGGLIGGFAASAIVSLPKRINLKHSFSVLAISILSIVGLLHIGYSQDETINTYTVYFQLGLDYVDAGEMEKAEEYFQKIVDADEQIVKPLLLDSYFYLSYTQVHLYKLFDAEENLLKVIQLDEDNLLPEAHFNLALVYFQLGRFSDSYEQIKMALKEDPKNEDYINFEQELDNILN